MVLGVGGSSPLTHPTPAGAPERDRDEDLIAARGIPTPSEVEASIADLFALEPRLSELEREVDAVRDDGRSSWFCSNYLWLPVNTRLRLLIGVARLPQPGDEDRSVLYDSRTYELVFEFLSRRLPPCRGCGCRRFLALRTS